MNATHVNTGLQLILGITLKLNRDQYIWVHNVTGPV